MRPRQVSRYFKFVGSNLASKEGSEFHPCRWAGTSWDSPAMEGFCLSMVGPGSLGSWGPSGWGVGHDQNTSRVLEGSKVFGDAWLTSTERSKAGG